MADNPFKDADLQPISVGDKAYDALKQAIIRREIRQGQRLVETQLAEMLNISRTPLREAILRLEAEGFLRRRPDGGVVVAMLSLREVRELYVVRSVLEGLAAREATARLSEDDLARLDFLVDEMPGADSRPADLQRIAQAGREFHQIILRASGNQKCADLLRLLRDHIDRYRRLSLAIPGHAEAAAEKHAAVVRAFRRGDSDEAERIMRRHVLGAWVSLVRTLREASAGLLQDVADDLPEEPTEPAGPVRVQTSQGGGGDAIRGVIRGVIRKKGWWIALWLLVILAPLAGGVGAAPARPRHGGTLTVAVEADLRESDHLQARISVDPHDSRVPPIRDVDGPVALRRVAPHRVC